MHSPPAAFPPPARRRPPPPPPCAMPKRRRACLAREQVRRWWRQGGGGLGVEETEEGERLSNPLSEQAAAAGKSKDSYYSARSGGEKSPFCPSSHFPPLPSLPHWHRPPNTAQGGKGGREASFLLAFRMESKTGFPSPPSLRLSPFFLLLAFARCKPKAGVKPFGPPPLPPPPPSSKMACGRLPTL